MEDFLLIHVEHIASFVLKWGKGLLINDVITRGGGVRGWGVDRFFVSEAGERTP